MRDHFNFVQALSSIYANPSINNDSLETLLYYIQSYKEKNTKIFIGVTQSKQSTHIQSIHFFSSSQSARLISKLKVKSVPDF